MTDYATSPITTRPTKPWSIPNFRYLWFGLLFISSGVQFYAVALTWLVLDLTGSSLQLGILLAVGAVPRAIMMLFSGALVDCSPPRSILLGASFASGIILAGVALLLSWDWLNLLYLSVVTVLLGLLDAFFYPTIFAMNARIVDKQQLGQSNALIQGADGLINMLAPAGSGLLVGIIGLMPAFIVNSLLFFVGCTIVWCINAKLLHPLTKAESEATESYIQAVLNGFRYAVQKPAIRLSLLMLAALNFAGIGPTIIGGAILVEQRFRGDASMYGILLSAYGVGGFMGSLMAARIGYVKRPGVLMIGVAFIVGLSLILTGFAPSFPVAFVIQAISGVIVGIAMPFFSGWLQRETDMQMQGRISSLVAFAAVAVDPFSQSVAGILSQIDVTMMFVAAGVLMMITGLVVSLNPVVYSVVEKAKY